MKLDDFFAGLMGSWLAIEPFLATGIVGALVMKKIARLPTILKRTF
jgi:hydroxylamine reductase (hybrid-cluster protein)